MWQRLFDGSFYLPKFSPDDKAIAGGGKKLDAKKSASGAGTGDGDDEEDDDESGDDADSGDDGTGGKKPKLVTMTQEALDALVLDKKSQWDRTKSEEAQEELDAAEAKRLREEQKFKELAETLETKNKTLETQLGEKNSELESKQVELDEANSGLETYVKKLRGGVDQSILALLEGRSLAAQLSWLAEHAGETSDEKTRRSIKKTPESNNSGGDPSLDAAKEESKSHQTRTTRTNF